MTQIISTIVIGIIIQCVFIKCEHDERYTAAVVLKYFASLMFVYLGYSAYSLTLLPFTTAVFIGLALGLVGDVLMNLRFVVTQHEQKIFLGGILAFLLGHIAYLVAIVPEAKNVNILLYVIIGLVLAGSFLAYVFKAFDIKPAFKIFGVFYLGVIFVMTSLAVGIMIASPTIMHKMFGIGAILFTLSDVVLIFNTFSGTTRFYLRVTNLLLYYFGQMLIATSMLFIFYK